MAQPVDLSRLARTTDQVFSLDELQKRMTSGRPLRIKYGVDVTASFLHIGHAVNLWMMRLFQEQGHKLVFLIGDFTTQIGDPTGKNKKRVVPSRDDIERNAGEFLDQVGQVILTDDEVFEVRRNSEWWGKMDVGEFLSLVAQITHARLIERDMFQKRIAEHAEIHMHELLYPILQGYDSVMLKSDLTIVGSDQLFNEMMGRLYQERAGQEPQIVLTTKITPGTDGKEKQSKSLGNYIALADTPRDKFGKTMSIPDELVASYLEVYTELTVTDEPVHPMESKKRLAQGLVERYHGSEVAVAERRWFEEVFSKKQDPGDVPEIPVSPGSSIGDVLTRCLPGSSKSDLRRLLQQGAVRVNQEKAPETDLTLPLKFLGGDVLRIGRSRFFRLRVEREGGEQP